jgi:hypothetical protein
MTTDWRNEQINRLEQRIDKVEQGIWEKEQRSLQRSFNLFLAIYWAAMIAFITYAITRAALT